MAGTPIQIIEQTYSVPFGGQIQQGDIQRFADGTRFFLQSATAILAALDIVGDDHHTEFEAIIAQLEFCIPNDLIPFASRPLSISRGACLALAGVGIRTIDALAELPALNLIQIVGEATASRIRDKIHL